MYHCRFAPHKTYWEKLLGWLLCPDDVLLDDERLELDRELLLNDELVDRELLEKLLDENDELLVSASEYSSSQHGSLELSHSSLCILRFFTACSPGTARPAP